MNSPQYTLPQSDKERLLLHELNSLTDHHKRACPDYEKILAVMRPGYVPPVTLEDVSDLPIRIFKSHRLRTIPASDIFKTLTSSGTTGAQPSQVSSTAKRRGDRPSRFHG